MYTSPSAGFKLTTLVVISTDCTGCYKSNWHHDHNDPLQSKIYFWKWYLCCNINCIIHSDKYYRNCSLWSCLIYCHFTFCKLLTHVDFTHCIDILVDHIYDMIIIVYWLPRYNWNIVESDTKQHKTNPNTPTLYLNHNW